MTSFVWQEEPWLLPFILDKTFRLGEYVASFLSQLICGRAKAARLDPGPGSTRAANRLVQALTASIDVGISSSSIIHTFTIVIHTSKEVLKGTSRCCYQ